MPTQPYVLVLAQTSHEGAKYVRRANLPRGRWRVVAKASSIRGIRRAEVHCLPGFHKRPDKHAILGELRYAQCEWRDVEMPGPGEAAPVDQGDGMGQQLTIEQVIADASSLPRPGLKLAPVLTPEDIAALDEIPWTIDERNLEVAYRYNRLLDLEPPFDANAIVVSPEEHARLHAGLEDSNMLETPKAKRRRKCNDCGTSHYKDEACSRTDGVEEAPVVTPATMFD